MDYVELKKTRIQKPAGCQGVRQLELGHRGHIAVARKARMSLGWHELPETEMGGGGGAGM